MCPVCALVPGLQISGWGDPLVSCDRNSGRAPEADVLQTASCPRDTQGKLASGEFHRGVWLPQGGGPGYGIGLEMTGP